MILVFPIALSDKGKTQHLIDALRAFGPYHGDKALIVPTPGSMLDGELKKAVYDIAALFGGSEKGGNAFIRPISNDPDGGWPRAANIHFQFIVEYVSQMSPQEPWMIIESDTVPIKPRWTSRLMEEYSIMGNAFLGAIEPSRFVYSFPGGRKEQRVEGEHVVGGCCIYPPNYTRTNCASGAPRVTWNYPDLKIPYDIRAQWEHTPVSPSRIMLHRPRTVNWRTEDGVIKCDDEAGKPDEFGNSSAGEVDLSEIVVVHGCKDGSLTRVALAREITDKKAEIQAPAKAIESAPAEQVHINVDPFKPKFTQVDDSPPPKVALEGISGVEELKRMWIEKNPDLDPGIFDDMIAKKISDLKMEISGEQPKAEEKPAPKIGDYSKIISFLESSADAGKKVKLADLSKATEIPLNKLEKMLKLPEAPFERKKFGFINLKEKVQ